MKTGDRLPNGAIVLLEKEGVILAQSTGPQPYVTWVWDQKDPASTYWGHYHSQLSVAAYDFEGRVERSLRVGAHG